MATGTTSASRSPAQCSQSTPSEACISSVNGPPPPADACRAASLFVSLVLSPTARQREHRARHNNTLRSKGGASQRSANGRVTDVKIRALFGVICHSAEATQEVPPRTTSGTSDPAPIARCGAPASTRLATQAPPQSTVPHAESGPGGGQLVRSGVRHQMAPNVQMSDPECVPRGPTRPCRSERGPGRPQPSFCAFDMCRRQSWRRRGRSVRMKPSYAVRRDARRGSVGRNRRIGLASRACSRRR
jgi:hypothetical protein